MSRPRVMAVIAGIVGFLANTRAAEPATPAGRTNVLTPELVAVLKSVTSVAVAPDGRSVAYTVSVPRQPGVDDDGEPWTELWVAGLPEGEPRPFVTGKGQVDRVAWTPDSRALVFLAKRGDDAFKALYRLPIDGGEARRAAGLKADVVEFSLAPDGVRVALVGSEPEDEGRKKLREKGFKQEVFEEEARPARLWVTRLFETNTGPALVRPLELTGSVRQVRWSPAGDALAVAVTPTPSVDDGMMRQRVVFLDPRSGARTGEVQHEGKLGAFEWSPDGQWLAMQAGEDRHDPSAGRLFVVPSSGGAPRQVRPGWEADVARFAWTGPRRLIAVVDAGVRTHLVGCALRERGVEVGKEKGTGGVILTALSVSADGGVMAGVGSSPRHPAELFTWKAGDEPRRRTDSNPALAPLRWAAQEGVRYRARDGVELEGILIRPLEPPTNGRAPLILSVHGGPEAHVSDGWLTTYSGPGQVAAARGFAVFHPNYRGSTGRGVAFSKLGQGDAAGREFDDLVDAVDHLVGMGLVDAARVGVTGGSYGGYATAWCSTRYSDRFAAGVMFVGISDKISKVGTTDIPDEEYLVHARQRPWENWQFLLERSPIFHAGESRTPLLILHGADDPRVHPSQSKEMYRHLKLRGQAPVRLVLYPGEGHGNRKAAARYDYHLRMLQWFEHYLVRREGGVPGLGPDYGTRPAPAAAP